MDNVALGMALRRKPMAGQGDQVGDALSGLIGSSTAFAGDMKNMLGNKGDQQQSQPQKTFYMNEGTNLTPDSISSGGTVMTKNGSPLTPTSYELGSPSFKRGGRLRKAHKFAPGGDSPTTSGGAPYGQIGSAIDTAATMQTKLIGNTYGSRKDPWTDAVRTTAYGDNTDNPLFAKSTRNAAGALSDDLANKSLFHAQSNSTAGLMNDISDKAKFSNTVADPSFGRKVAGVHNASVRGAGWGSKVGASVGGGYGMAIGAIAGGLAGLGRGIGNAINGKRRLKNINSAIEARNNYNAASVNTAVNNLGKKQNNAAMTNYAYSDGGHLDSIGSMAKRHARLFAEGGKISNSKNQYRTGMTEFTTGGTHEENPNGGIPQGMAPDGLPNLVEQGEVKLSSITGKENNYILSNRLVIDEDVADAFGIDRKYVGETFAKAFKKAYAPFKERPNDPISRREVAYLANRFQGAQEALKARQEEDEAEYSQRNPSDDALASMGQQAKQAGMEAAQGQRPSIEEQMPQHGIEQDPMTQQQMMQQQPGMEQQTPMEQGQQPVASPEEVMAMAQGQQPPMGQSAAGFAALGGMIRKRKFSRGGHLFSEGGEEKIKKFQKYVGLPETGVWGDAEKKKYEELQARAKEGYGGIRYSGGRQTSRIQEITGTGVDGKYGPKTRAAVKALQALVGTKEDGKWGPKTEKAFANWMADFDRDVAGGDTSGSTSSTTSDSASGSDNSSSPSTDTTATTSSETNPQATTTDEGTGTASAETPVTETPQQVEPDASQYESNIEKARRIAEEMNIRGHMAASNARYAHVVSALRGLVDKDRYLNPDKYNAYEYEAMRRLHDDPRLINAYQRSRLINPEAMAAGVKAAGATTAANAARMSGGNPGLAAVAALAAGNSTAAAMGDSYLKAHQFNNAARQADNKFNLDVQQQNANAINAVNAQNDNLRTNSLRNIAETVGSADAWNINHRLDAQRNAAKVLGQFGNEELDRATIANMASQGILHSYLTNEQNAARLRNRNATQTPQSINSDALINNGTNYSPITRQQ